MRKTTNVLAAVVLTGLCMTANAADDYVYDGRFYVAPKVSYGLFGQAHHTPLEDGHGVGFGIAIGKPINKYWNLEAYYFNYDDVEPEDGTGPIDQEGYGLTALYFPAPEQSRVYLLAGYAVGTYQIDGTDFKTEVDYLDLGYGYMHQITDYGIAIRVEYRYRNTDVDGATDDSDNHIISLSLQIPLGTPPGQS